jgi:hypothetical protein
VVGRRYFWLFLCFDGVFRVGLSSTATKTDSFCARAEFIIFSDSAQNDLIGRIALAWAVCGEYREAFLAYRQNRSESIGL